MKESLWAKQSTACKKEHRIKNFNCTFHFTENLNNFGLDGWVDSFDFFSG